MDIKMNNYYVRCQLDNGRDLSMISENTWKKIDKLKLTHTKKDARGLSGNKFKGEVICNVSFGGRTVKAKVYVLNNISYLFDTDWIALFDLSGTK